MAKLMAEPQAIVDAAKMLADGIDPDTVRKTMAGRINAFLGTGANLTRATTLATGREPARTEKQEAVSNPEAYRMQQEEQMRQLFLNP